MRVYQLAAICAGLFALTIASAQWPNVYDYQRDVDWANKVAVDHRGNVIIVGTGKSTTQGKNWIIRSFGPSGSVNWTQTYNGSAGSDDWATDVAVDWQGNVYVAGISTNTHSTGANRDFTVVKYEGPSGTAMWPASGTGTNYAYYNGGIHLVDDSPDGLDRLPEAMPDSMTCSMTIKSGPDGADNIAITGRTGIVALNQSAVVKWRTTVLEPENNDAHPIIVKSGWPVDQFGTSVNYADVPYGIAWASDNSIYVVGLAEREFTTVRYAASGNLNSPNPYLWTRASSGNGSVGRAIVLDHQDNAYVTGYVPSTSSSALYTARLKASDGTVDWPYTYEVTGPQRGTSIDISYELESGILVPYISVAGRSDEIFGTNPIKTVAIRLDAATGSQQWRDISTAWAAPLAPPPLPFVKDPSTVAQGRGNQYVLSTIYGTTKYYARLDAFRINGTTRFSGAGTSLSTTCDSGYGLVSRDAGLVGTTGIASLTSDDAVTNEHQETNSTVGFSSVAVTGTIVSGSPGDYIIMPLSTASRPQISVEYIGYVPTNLATPSELTIKTNSHAITNGMTEWIEVYNFRTASYEIVGQSSVPAASSDGTNIIVLKDDPAEYIDTLTGQMKIRVRYYTVSYTATAHFGNCEWHVLGA